MSLLQEIEKYGLADCEFNWQLIRNERRINRLISIYLPVFNDHQELEGDYDLIMDSNRAQNSAYFLYWLDTWSDEGRRGELAELLRGLK
jgi:hypothetical protein